MKSSDLPNLRRLAKANLISYTAHALDQMLERGISTDDVESILGSNTNQLIEIQSPSVTPGKVHRDERNLIYDPEHNPDAIVIVIVATNPSLELVVVTAELPDYSIWNKNPGKVPAITRK